MWFYFILKVKEIEPWQALFPPGQQMLVPTILFFLLFYFKVNGFTAVAPKNCTLNICMTILRYAFASWVKVRTFIVICLLSFHQCALWHHMPVVLFGENVISCVDGIVQHKLCLVHALRLPSRRKNKENSKIQLFYVLQEYSEDYINVSVSFRAGDITILKR